MKFYKRITGITAALFFIFLMSCTTGETQPSARNSNPDKKEKKYLTENVIIIVIDGPRYSETWGDSTHKYIPNLARLARNGAVFTNFYNNGYTYTNAGYSTILNGNYEGISNTGTQFPENPSLFQYYLSESKNAREKAWIIQSKGKLKILADCQAESWEGQFIPSFICGLDGGYSEDEKTLELALEKMKEYHPNLMMVGFKEPDHSAHSEDWKGYLEGIKKTDEHVFTIWNFIQQDSLYKGKTSLFVTNDHGRHLDSKGGFAHHGDKCEGCRHINLFVAGPDFTNDIIISTDYELLDISATIAELMGLVMPTGKGKVIREVLGKKKK